MFTERTVRSCLYEKNRLTFSPNPVYPILSICKSINTQANLLPGNLEYLVGQGYSSGKFSVVSRILCGLKVRAVSLSILTWRRWKEVNKTNDNPKGFILLLT